MTSDFVKLEWIEIDPFNDSVPNTPFFLSDDYGTIYVGSTAFDFYDAKYWFPIPSYPMSKGVITNDKCITAMAKTGMLK